MDSLRNDILKEANNLGKSKEYKAALLAYVDNLESKKLPVIFDSHHLAHLLGIDYSKFKELVLKRDGYYKYYTIKKRNGGLRRILSPFGNIKRIQRWILENILDNIDSPICVTGFVKGKSILDNARAHENRNYIMKLDLKDFFGSINSKRVYGFFLNLGYGKQLAYDLAKICTTEYNDFRVDELKTEEEKICFAPLEKLQNGFLVQGAPTSPSIANKIAYKLDCRLKALADKHAATYTRYADDITFSADDKKDLPSIDTVKKIINSEGFTVNDYKTGIYSAKQQQEVTGLLIDGHVRVSSRYKRDIMRHLHFCKKYSVKEHVARFCPNKSDFQYWLYGRICFVYSVEPDVGKKMFDEFDSVNWFE